MFAIGDKVVCINDTITFGNISEIEINKIYEVQGVNDGKTFDYISIIGVSHIYPSKNFLSIPNYRRLKIEKLKERLCLQSVIK